MGKDSVITVFIAGHGAEYYENKPLNAPNVRVLSLAASPFCFSWSNPKELILNDDFEIDYINSVQYMLNMLIDHFNSNPDKGTLEILKNFAHFYKPHYSDIQKKASEVHKRLDPEDILHTDSGLNPKTVLRLMTPQSDKVYDIRPSSETDSLFYGVYIVNVKNPPEGLDFLVPHTDLRMSELLGNYINEISDTNRRDKLLQTYNVLNTNTELMLSSLIEFLNTLGYEYINIVDTSCRTPLYNLHEPITERLIRRMRRKEQGPMTSLMGKRTKRKFEQMPGGKRRKKRTKKRTLRRRK